MTRFNPSASYYLSIQRALTDIDNAERLRTLFRQALLATDFGAFVRELSGANATTQAKDEATKDDERGNRHINFARQTLTVAGCLQRPS